MTAWLRELGHQVTVLTTRAWGDTAEDGDQVVRTADLVASQALRRLLARPALPSAGKGIPLQKPAPKILADVVVPDAYLLSWVAGAVPAARRLIAERAIDCVVTSGPPHSAHLLGLGLGRHAPGWIADFRDGWRYETLRAPWPTTVQDRVDAALERRVVASADGIVAVTKPIVDDFARRLGAESALIPNGWDPRLEPMLADAARPMLDPRYLNIVHTGQLSGLRGRDPRPLFKALKLLSDRNPDASNRLRIVLAGRLDIAEQQMLAGLGHDSGIVHIGHLERTATAALQRDADALLLMTSIGHPSQATGKLFEYLTAGRPIIALAKDNEAARIVTQTRTGVTAAPDQPEEIADALLASVDGRLAEAYSPRRLDQYIYPAPAAEFAAEVERILARHRNRINVQTAAQ